MRVKLGNPRPQQARPMPPGGHPVRARAKGDDFVCGCGCEKSDLYHEPLGFPSTLEVTFAGSESIADALTAITAADGHWNNHSWGWDVKPSWVSSTSPGLALVLGEHFGCPVRPWGDAAEDQGGSDSEG